MSDIKLFVWKKNKEINRLDSKKINIKKIIETNCETLLGITKIGSNISVSDNDSLIVETIGYDEDNRLVIIEYRQGKFTSIIKKGLVTIDYINEYPTKTKMKLQSINPSLSTNINCSPRLIIIGDNFSSFDAHAISQMPYEISLIKWDVYKGDEEILVLENIYQSKQECIANKRYITNPFFLDIHQFILSLGDEVVAYGNEHYISYRRIKNFAYLIFQDDLLIKVRESDGQYRDYVIKKGNDCEKIKKRLEQSYDEG